MTPFSSVLSRLGLSQAEAAAALDEPLDTIRSWSCGRLKVPAYKWPKIAALARRRAAELSADCLALAEEIETRIQRAA